MDNPTSPIEQQIDTNKPALKRPGGVTILVLGVLIITVFNLTRLVLSLKYWDFLASWPGVSPLYVALTGLIWTLAGMPLIFGLWKAKSWAPRLMQAVALTYALYYWLEQVFLIDHPVSGPVEAKRAFLPVNWPFAAAVTAICLAFMAWTLNRPKVKAYFGIPGEANPDQGVLDSGDIE